MNTGDTIPDTDRKAVFEHFSTGKPLDPKIAERVRAKGQKIRREIFEQHGILDVGVPAIRELRGDLPEE